MSESEQEPKVTKREFNSALALVWVFITIAMGTKLQVEREWSSGLLFVGALLISLAYTAASVRRRRRPAAVPGDWTTAAKQLLAAGDKIGAITTVRNGTRLSLQEAKELVETWARNPEGRSSTSPEAG